MSTQTTTVTLLDDSDNLEFINAFSKKYVANGGQPPGDPDPSRTITFFEKDDKKKRKKSTDKNKHKHKCNII